MRKTILHKGYRPPEITVTTVLSRKKHPKWNYARMLNFLNQTETLIPCCLKAKPCCECK